MLAAFRALILGVIAFEIYRVFGNSEGIGSRVEEAKKLGEGI
jgi:hypothetical protein